MGETEEKGRVKGGGCNLKATITQGKKPDMGRETNWFLGIKASQ